MNAGLKTVNFCDHVIAIYPDRKSKLEEAFQFLKEGLERDEVIMFVSEDIEKLNIKKLMQVEFRVDIGKLESQGIVILKKVSEWYFPDGNLNAQKVRELWSILARDSVAKGKHGLRIFADTKAFFTYGFGADLVKYESTLEPRFNIPFTAICAYESEDINLMSPEEQDILFGQQHHHPILLHELTNDSKTTIGHEEILQPEQIFAILSDGLTNRMLQAARHGFQSKGGNIVKISMT